VEGGGQRRQGAARHQRWPQSRLLPLAEARAE
jgi:hypothetical protein